MKGTGLRRAVLLGLAMSLTVGTVGYAESIYEGSLIADTGDIIYGGEDSTDNYIITADEEHSAIELSDKKYGVSVTTQGDITLNNSSGYGISTTGTESQGYVTLTGNDISITGSGILLDYANNNGYGNDEKAVYADINASGNFVIGKDGDGNIATSGLQVDTYGGTIDVNAGKGILIDVEGSLLVGASESGHVNMTANEDIILDANSSSFLVQGYIQNMNMQNQESEDGELIGINGLRTSDITIETTGTVKLSATDTSQSSYVNVGIFATGTRKGQMPPVTSDNPADAPYIDEDGYRMSDDNITTITGNIVDISITNKNGMAVGILAQKSDKVYVNLNSTEGINFTTTSEQGIGAVGLDVADGNINFTTTMVVIL